MTVLVMVFIFVQSAFPADLSSKESGFFVELLSRILSNITSVNMDRAEFAVRKAAHFTEYMLLGIALYGSFHYTEKAGRPGKILSGKYSRFLCAWLIGTLYAMTDECHQYFIPGRSCEIRDMLIDSAGVLMGAVIVWVIFYLRSSPSE